jgi:hypothetical protein
LLLPNTCDRWRASLKTAAGCGFPSPVLDLMVGPSVDWASPWRHCASFPASFPLNSSWFYLSCYAVTISQMALNSCQLKVELSNELQYCALQTNSPSTLLLSPGQPSVAPVVPGETVIMHPPLIYPLSPRQMTELLTPRDQCYLQRGSSYGGPVYRTLSRGLT